MERKFKMKYNFYYEKDGIPQGAILNWITVINTFYLVEDVETKNRAWVSRFDIERIGDNDN